MTFAKGVEDVGNHDCHSSGQLRFAVEITNMRPRNLLFPASVDCVQPTTLTAR